MRYTDTDGQTVPPISAIPRWIDRRTISVMPLDGSERVYAFPRLMVFRVDGRWWGGCVVAAAGRRTWLPASSESQDDAKAACLHAARSSLPEWHHAIHAALKVSGAAVEPGPPPDPLGTPPHGRRVVGLRNAVARIFAVAGRRGA